MDRLNTLDDFVKKTGMLGHLGMMRIIYKLPNRRLRKALVDNLKESGSFDAHWESGKMLRRLLRARPDLHIITTVDADNGKDLVYDNSKRYVNRIDFYIGRGSKNASLFYTEVF